jgi:regulator of protease activity HflC (stomatin/prohibitin superfamily)
MGYTIFLGILGLIALAVLVSGFLSKPDSERRGYDDLPVRKILLGVGAGFAVLFAGFLIGGSMENVNARTVGIVTEFGKATGTLSPGLNWVAPWADVTEFSTGNQSLDLDATDGNGGNVAVKFAGGGAGAANVNINWQVQDDNKATKLWENWKEFDIVADKVVNKQAQSVVYQVVGHYAPEDAVKSDNVAKINQEIKDQLNNVLATSGIRVENVAVMRIDLSPELQDRVNKQNQAVTDQQTAKTQQETAKIEAGTNEIKQKQLTPFTLMDKCLDIVNKWNVQNNGPMPAAGVCGALGNQVLALPGK